ncbi:MAG TPA: hypothetical protein VG711_11875, partial [Phycisphaerales bacterium]|nr:hypothetical protein [Phycisphaerales bacterium]
MKRVLFFIYGLFCHALFLVVYAWMAMFLGNFGLNFVTTIDSPREVPLGRAVLIDLCLIALFGFQHSVMARPGFKKWWTQFVPQPIERSTFVLASCICMIALLTLWQPIGFVVWDVTSPAIRVALHALFAIG